MSSISRTYFSTFLGKPFITIIACVFFALLCSLAFIFNAVLLFVVGFLGFLFLLKNSTIKQALLFAILYPLVFFSVGLSFLFFIGENYPPSFAVAINVVNSLYVFWFIITFFLPVFFIIVLPKHPDFIWAMFVMPVAFTFHEWLKTFFLTGFPWFQISHLLVDFIDVEYSVFGELGVGFICYSIIGVFFLLVKKDVICSLFGVAVISPFLLVNFFDIGNVSIEAEDKLSVKAFYSDTDIAEKSTFTMSVDNIDSMLKAARDVPLSDLVLFPEGTLKRIVSSYPAEIRKNINEIKNKNVDFLMGGYFDNNYGEYNAVFKNDEYEPVYTKQHLIPFAEYFPKGFNFFERFFPDFYRANLVSDDFYAKEIGVFGHYIAPLICYEIFFSDQIRNRFSNFGAFIVFTDLAFVNSHWPKQYMFNVARVRAMEFSKPLVQVANSSITAFVDHRGKVESSVYGEASYIQQDVILNYDVSIYNRYGLLMVMILPLLNLLIIISYYCFLLIKRPATD